MFDLSSIFTPITAQPFIEDETYIEIKPCKALKPYIRCFWGTPKPISAFVPRKLSEWLVTPDTCMDVIFNIDSAKQTMEDRFSGINITSFSVQPLACMPSISRFAIRFYPWAVPFFAAESMRNSLDANAEVDSYFRGFTKEFYNLMTDSFYIAERVVKAEEYLIKRINLNRLNTDVMNAVYFLLKLKGVTKISDLSDYTAVSHKQLERLFSEYVGISPKKLSGLIRYQRLWKDILTNRTFNVQDAVLKYGYTDQPHLINDFKKHHSMTPGQAKLHAYAAR